MIFDMSIVADRLSFKNPKMRLVNNVDPDKTAHDASCQDPHYLQRYMFWSAKMKELMIK